MLRNSRVFIAGHRGLVGSAVVRKLQTEGYTAILTRTRNELDLTDQQAVDDFFSKESPDYVILAAAKVGGIHANATYPADFIRDNLLIQTNTIDAAARHGCTKLIFLGSSCIYPKLAKQPMAEDELLSGPLEPSNQWYAIAKIAGIKLCQAMRRQYGLNAISIMPTNLYGPGDNFHPENSHVIPGLIQRMHAAKISGADSIRIWGSGAPLREFLHVDDLASALLFLARHYDEEEHINVGTGEEISIKTLAETIKKVVGFKGELLFGSPEKDGTPRKLLDSSKLHALGWRHSLNLEEGLSSVYAWYLTHVEQVRKS